MTAYVWNANSRGVCVWCFTPKVSSHWECFGGVEKQAKKLSWLKFDNQNMGNHFRIIGVIFNQYNSQALLLPDWSPLSLFVVLISGRLQRSNQNANSFCVLCTVKTKSCELNNELCRAIHYALSNNSIATAQSRLPGTSMITFWVV